LALNFGYRAPELPCLHLNLNLLLWLIWKSSGNVLAATKQWFDLQPQELHSAFQKFWTGAEIPHVLRPKVQQNDRSGDPDVEWPMPASSHI